MISPRFLALVVLLAGSARSPGEQPPLTDDQAALWQWKIRQALHIDNAPNLAAQEHGSFAPVPGVVAYRVSYATQYGLRVPAILYLPEQRRGRVPGLIIVNGH